MNQTDIINTEPKQHLTARTKITIIVNGVLAFLFIFFSIFSVYIQIDFGSPNQNIYRNLLEIIFTSGFTNTLIFLSYGLMLTGFTFSIIRALSKNNKLLFNFIAMMCICAGAGAFIIGPNEFVISDFQAEGVIIIALISFITLVFNILIDKETLIYYKNNADDRRRYIKCLIASNISMYSLIAITASYTAMEKDNISILFSLFLPFIIILAAYAIEITFTIMNKHNRTISIIVFVLLLLDAIFALNLFLATEGEIIMVCGYILLPATIEMVITKLICDRKYIFKRKQKMVRS